MLKYVHLPKYVYKPTWYSDKSVNCAPLSLCDTREKKTIGVSDGNVAKTLRDVKMKGSAREKRSAHL